MQQFQEMYQRNVLEGVTVHSLGIVFVHAVAERGEV